MLALAACLAAGLGARSGAADTPPQAPPPRDYRDGLVRVQRELHAGEPAPAAMLALQTILLDPNGFEAHVYAGIAFFQLDMLDRAELHYARAAKLAPAGFKPFLDTLLEAVRDKRPFNHHLEFADLATAHGRDLEAAEALTNAWRIFAARHDIALEAGMAWEAGGNCARALAIFRFLAKHGSPGELAQVAAAQLAQGLCAKTAPSEPPNLDYFACPPGGVLRPGEKRCACSTLAPAWLQAEKRCATCAGGKLWSGGACSCPAGTQDVGGQCQCPVAGQVWSSRAMSCVACGTDGLWDSARCRCPAGTTWNGLECVCPEDRPAWSAASRTCEPRSTCQAGSVCGCQGGQLWGGDKCACPPSLPVATEYGCQAK